MEEVLEQIGEASGKHAALQQACREARELVEAQTGLLRCPPHELREKCLAALTLALDTRTSKLVTLAVSGFYKVLRDSQFHSGYVEDDESCWLSSQLLDALASLHHHPEDVQVELLKVVLNMCCLGSAVVSGQVVVRVVGVCLRACGRGGTSVRTAAQSAASQAVAHLVKQLNEEMGEQEGGEDGYVVPVYDELVPVVTYVADKLLQANKQPEDKKAGGVPVVFLLETTITLLHQLSREDDPSPTYYSKVMVDAFWQKLIPALIALLGSPVSQRLARPAGRMDGQMGRGSGCLAHPGPLFNNVQARAIYNVACQLVVALGSVGEMRPVLECLFHRMLLYPPPQCRLDALKAVSELLSNPSKLALLAGPILHTDPRNPHQNDLALLRLVMDSLAECGNCSNVHVQRAVVDCISGLLQSLEKISQGGVLSPRQVKTINQLYKQLEDVDYSGPLTYENKSKMPKYDVTAMDPNSEDESALTSHHESGSDNESLELEASGRAAEGEGGVSEDNEPSEANEAASQASGDTEGPELEDEKQKELEEYVQEVEQQREEQEALRLHRLNESLQSTSNLRHLVSEECERECENGRHFTATLCSLLPSLLAVRSTIEVDEAVLEFSSKYCEGVFNVSSQQHNQHIIINADGIYLATYSVLSLNLKLIRQGHYCNPDLAPPLTEEQFVEVVHGSGVLVYLSSAWLGEVYRQVVRDSFLQRAGYSPHSQRNCALINLLTDLDGLGSIEQNSQLLSDHRRLEKAASNIIHPPQVLAGMKLCRRIVTCCWESVVAVLAAVLGGPTTGGLVGPLKQLLGGEGVREESRRTQDLLAQCLNALQSTAKLANVLGLQSRCGVVFSLLSSACLPSDASHPRHALRSPAITKKQQRLHTAHLWSLQVMMSSGLELGSHAADCWTHIFKCCVYLADLEHNFFSNTSRYQSFPTRYAPPPLTKERLDRSYSIPDTSDELYRFVMVSPPAPGTNIEQLIHDTQKESATSGVLSPQDTGKAICALTQMVDRLFDDAATKLNMSSLVSFLAELCAASQQQLFQRMKQETHTNTFIKWKKGGKGGSRVEMSGGGDLLLLQRLAEVMLRVVRSGRPLLHIMRAWAVAGPHFMEAACHKDGSVSKRAVTAIHDIVNAILSSQTELPHFHFNEALFKPFENLLCLELCDADVQDQIISCICEFVESCTTEIKSGWRPLFGALRCVHPPRTQPATHPPPIGGRGSCDSVGHLHIVRDVFEAFLATDNVLVFANAALDCILCLLKHVKGTGDECGGGETVVGWGELVAGDLCLDALRFLHRCATILATMGQMPACPVFHAAHRISLSGQILMVDPHLPNVDENLLGSLVKDIFGDSSSVSYSALWPRLDHSSLANLNSSSGILQVWYVLLEGLAGGAVTCPRRYQPQLLDTLFSLFKSLLDSPGPVFGLHCINHLLLPMIQGWLRKSYTAPSAWDFTPSFKQCVGLTSDLVVDYFNALAERGSLAEQPGALLVLRQCCLVLLECVAHPTETISRLGCACLRHVITSCGEHFPAEYWDVVAASIHRACMVTLYPLLQLMNLFHPESPNFYGDVGQVKVAARRDCTGKDSDRLRQLSHQVFLLDTQRHLASALDNPDAEDRSFIFLLYPEEVKAQQEGHGRAQLEEIEPSRVPFRTLVVGLLAHQILLQTLGSLLLQGSPHIIPSLANVLLQGMDFSLQEGEDGRVAASEGRLPGHLRLMAPRHIHTFLDALNMSYLASVEFDSRPGLKFLIQKVAQAERAANLYKQAGASWTLRMVTLFDLTLSQVKHGLDLDQVKNVLEKDAKQKNTLKAELSDGMKEDTDEKCLKLQRPCKLTEGETMTYIQQLREAFTELCDVYIDLVVDKDGHYSAVDKINDQPIFFLTVQPDEFPTSHRKSLAEWSRSLEEFNDQFKTPLAQDKPKEPPREDDKDAAEKSQSQEQPSDKGEVEDPREAKPFSFSDLARDYSSDSSDSDSEGPEYADGGDSGLASMTDGQQSIYKVVTEREIAALVTDYRRRKNHHALPSQRRTNPFSRARPPPVTVDPVPQEIEEQRTNSLMKDKEAHVKVWTEMVVTVFDLVSQLNDSELRPLLPLVFPTVRALTAHASDPHLRQVVAELLARVATLYGFSPAD